MSLEIQQRIKNNAKDVKDYLNDLYEWEDQMDQKNKHQSEIKAEQKVQPVVIIQKEIQKDQKHINEQFKTLKRDINTVGDYYKAWDKFDVQQELNALDPIKKVYNPYENSKNNIRAKPKVEMVVKGGRQIVKDPTSLKDRGNMFFNSCQFDKAIQCYSQCLQKLQSSQNKQLKAIVYSNRAMAYLKRNLLQQTVSDCNKSLQFNSQFIKSYSRRAAAYKRMKKFKLAKTDYQKILQLQKTNQQAPIELKRIQKILQQLIKEAHSKLIMNMDMSSKPTERIQIVQVEQEIKSESTNYLDEL